jgi:hypothetical protein
VEVRGFEPLTPCMPSARGTFRRVQTSPNRLQLPGFQFISVHEDSRQFIPTAEVDAEVNPLRALQRVDKNKTVDDNSRCSAAAVLLKCCSSCAARASRKGTASGSFCSAIENIERRSTGKLQTASASELRPRSFTCDFRVCPSAESSSARSVGNRWLGYIREG